MTFRNLYELLNGRRLQQIRISFGDFHNWLETHHPQTIENWLKLFKATFKFVGPEVVREFLVSTGYLPGAHRETCPAFADIIQRHPPWCRVLFGQSQNRDGS